MVYQKGSLPQADATLDRLFLKCSVPDTDGEELKNSPFLFPSVQNIVAFQGQPIKGKAEPSRLCCLSISPSGSEFKNSPWIVLRGAVPETSRRLAILSEDNHM